MPVRSHHREVPKEHRAAEHLANERTFLAWVRTDIALISLGFVLARIGPWLREEKGEAAYVSRTLPLGIGIIIFGTVITVLAAWRYDSVNREIEEGSVKTDRGLVWFVAVTIVILSMALISYMLVMR